MKRKAVAVFLLIVLSVALFTGCAESFTYSYYIDEVGSVHYEYVLTYDADASDAEEIKNKAIAVATELSRNEKERSKIDASKPGRVSLTIVYSDLNELYIARGITGKEKPEPTDIKNKGIYQYAESETEMYSAVSERIRKLLGEEYADYPDPSEMYYVFGTRFASVRSNADRVEKKGAMYYHTWKAESGKPLNVVIRSYGLNATIVYGAIICVFVLSLVILFVIIAITNGKNRRTFTIDLGSGAGNSPVNDEIEKDDVFDLGKGE